MQGAPGRPRSGRSELLLNSAFKPRAGARTGDTTLVSPPPTRKGLANGGAVMLKITCARNLAGVQAPAAERAAIGGPGRLKGTGVLRVRVHNGDAPQMQRRDSLVGDSAQCPPRFLRTSQLPDLILWQHEGETSGRPPPHHGCEGSKLFQTRPMILLPILPQPNRMPTTLASPLSSPPAADQPECRCRRREIKVRRQKSIRHILTPS